MGVREDTLKMLRDGLSPKEITRKRGVNINTTLGYLDQLVGGGNLRRSDIFFSVPKGLRDAITKALDEEHFPEARYISSVLKKRGVNADPDDVLVVIKYGDSRHSLGDMYEDIRAIETHLHQFIRSALEGEYGEGELNWWRAIPLPIRQNCKCRQEEDNEPVTDAYCYTDLLDLWQILDKQWNVFKRVLPNDVTADKQALRGKVVRLNTIRRKVMHPVRGVTPSEDDFEFVREFKELLLGVT